MKKILFYSPDTADLETRCRTVSICQSLLVAIPELFIKITTGSSMIGGGRIPEGTAHLQRPSVAKAKRDGPAGEEFDRPQPFHPLTDSVLRQAIEFQPDLMLVDKMPHGVRNELLPVFANRREQLPQTKMAMILPDIIGSSTAVKEMWKKMGCFDAMERHYDQMLILGSPRVFDVREEYGFSSSISARTKFLGYMRRSRGMQSAGMIRNTLGVGVKEPLVVITSGENPNDVEFFNGYLNRLEEVAEHAGFMSLLALDSDMSMADQKRLTNRAGQLGNVKTLVVQDDLMSYIEAADLVVSRGGYRSMCEILTLKKAAVMVPRENVAQDESIRASRMARLGLVTMVPPDRLTDAGLIGTIRQALKDKKLASRNAFPLSLDALPKLVEAVSTLLRLPESEKFPPFPADEPGLFGTGSVSPVIKPFFSIML